MFRKAVFGAAMTTALVFGGLAHAGYDEGKALYAEGKYNEALQEFVNAGGEGNVDAVYRAALMFEAGEGTAKDDSKAMEKAADWFQTAARAGHTGAMKKLAKMFADGRGKPQDPVQAWAILQIAAERGDKEAAAQRDALAETMRPGQREAGKRRHGKLADTYQGS
ncbi:MAG: tetratricopeptide repeat protein [Minwuia sp.]|nr:tetratricopeptide repeat protein [Minwuia sp.]